MVVFLLWGPWTGGGGEADRADLDPPLGHELMIKELYINASEVLAPVLTWLFNIMVFFQVFGQLYLYIKKVL